MEQKADYTYNTRNIPCDEAIIRVKRWAARLQLKTRMPVFYHITRHKVEVWHGKMETKDHNKAVESLANILNRLMALR